MKKLFIGFSKAKSPWAVGSKIIQKIEKREYSHVFIKYNDNLTDIQIIAQASHGYVNQVNYELFCDQNTVVEQFELYCTDEQYKDVMFFIVHNLGKPYSKTQLFFITLKKLFGSELSYKNYDEEFVCSELAARICEILSIDDDIQDDYETPSDINNLLREYGCTSI